MKLRYLIPLYCLTSITLLPKEHTLATEISLEQIFNTTHIASDVELLHINRRCQELGLALTFRKVDNSTDSSGYQIEASIDIRGITLTIPQQILSSLYSHLTLHDPYAKTGAKVRAYAPNSSLCPEEIVATQARLQKCHDALEKLLGQKIPLAATPRIAVAGSGGGNRAAISVAGLLNGLDKNGFFDAISYISGVSGGTWTVISYSVADQDSFKDFYPLFMDRVTHSLLGLPEKEILEYLSKFLPTLNEFILRKLIFKDIPNVIDIYAFCLAVNFLGEQAANTFLSTGLMAQQKHVEKGERPYPLCTAIIPEGDTIHYDWLTFSPYEVASDDLTAGVAPWAFGRQFENGVSTNKSPFLPLGSYMAMCGSAISISFEELYEMYTNSIPQWLAPTLQHLSQPNIFGESRVFPAIVNNFTHNMKGFPRSTHALNTIVDSGISINLPIPPLLNPDRHIDIIIICDASGDVINAPELQKAQAYALAHNLPFPNINYSGITSQPFSIFDDGPSSKAPVVVYVPMIQNNTYSTTFNPQNNLGNGQFMSTFNFDYSLSQAHLLSGLFEEAINELKNPLIATIKNVIQRKS